MMKTTVSTLAAAAALAGAALRGAEPGNVMSAAYRQHWSPAVQERIDRDIDRHRKADAVLRLEGVPAGTDVEIEQFTHDFYFGANIFNFDQLGSDARNRRYKELFGTLFNSATIAFYWKTFEPVPGKPRFAGGRRDTAAYWNAVKEPKKQPHWRRPASDPVVAFCERKGIRLHGHPIAWGNRRWHHPGWLFEKYCPADEKKKLLQHGRKGLRKLAPAAIAALAPVYVGQLRRLCDKRITELAEHYRGRLHSWDVVNESATDFGLGRMIPGSPVCSSHYGLMPGDYAFRTFRMADRLFPNDVVLNINDYVGDERYLGQIRDLVGRGCRIDVVGSQMHLFKPQQCLDIAAGKPIQTPGQVRKKMALLGRAGLPIHLSEITITAPGDDARGRRIQAVIARNLYRLWFSIEPMMGITWWNVVDDCGAPGEPTISGLFTRDMQPKPSCHALDALINGAWKTRATVRVGADGAARFRGFKGRYRATFTDASGAKKQVTFHLAKDGNGIEQAGSVTTPPPHSAAQMTRKPTS